MQEGEQTEEGGVVTKAEGGTTTTHGNDAVGLADDVVPEGDGGTGGNAVVGERVAVADGHPLVVGIVYGQHLLGGEEVPETDAEGDVLHVGGDGV